MFGAVVGLIVCYLFFFFKQKTAYEMRISDWSSDVCSSDLEDQQAEGDDAQPVEIMAARGQGSRRDRRKGERTGNGIHDGTPGNVARRHRLAMLPAVVQSQRDRWRAGCRRQRAVMTRPGTDGGPTGTNGGTENRRFG